MMFPIEVSPSVKKDIRSVLLSSEKGVKLSNFARDYKELLGERLDFRSFNFNSIRDLLISIPDVCSLHARDGDAVVFPVLDNDNIVLTHTAQKALKNRPTSSHASSQFPARRESRDRSAQAPYHMKRGVNVSDGGDANRGEPHRNTKHFEQSRDGDVRFEQENKAKRFCQPTSGRRFNEPVQHHQQRQSTGKQLEQLAPPDMIKAEPTDHQFGHSQDVDYRFNQTPASVGRFQQNAGGNDRFQQSFGGSEQFQQASGGTKRFQKASGGNDRFQLAPGGNDRFQQAPGGNDRFQQASCGNDRFQQASGGNDRFQQASCGIGRFQQASGGNGRFQQAPGGNERFQQAPGGSDRFQHASGGNDRFQEASGDADYRMKPVQDTAGRPLDSTARTIDDRFDQPSATGSRFYQPRNPGNRFVQPQNPGNRFDQPGPTGNRFVQPRSTGNRFDHPRPIGNRFDHPRPTGNRFNQPGATGHRFQHPRFTGNRFPPRPYQSAAFRGSHPVRGPFRPPSAASYAMQSKDKSLFKWHSDLQPNLKGLYALCVVRRHDTDDEVVRKEFSQYGELKEVKVTLNYIFLRYAEKEEAYNAKANLDQTYDIRIPTERHNPKYVDKPGSKTFYHDPSGYKVYVANFDPNVIEADLRELFHGFQITKCQILSKESSGRKFAFVTLPSKAEAHRLVDVYHRHDFRGAQLCVQISFADRDELHEPPPPPDGFVAPGVLQARNSGPNDQPPPLEHVGQPPPLEHVGQPPPLEHVGQPPPLEHVGQPPPLEHVGQPPPLEKVYFSPQMAAAPRAAYSGGHTAAQWQPSLPVRPRFQQQQRDAPLLPVRPRFANVDAAGRDVMPPPPPAGSRAPGAALTWQQREFLQSPTEAEAGGDVEESMELGSQCDTELYSASELGAYDADAIAVAFAKPDYSNVVQLLIKRLRPTVVREDLERLLDEHGRGCVRVAISYNGRFPQAYAHFLNKEDALFSLSALMGRELHGLNLLVEPFRQDTWPSADDAKENIEACGDFKVVVTKNELDQYDQRDNKTSIRRVFITPHDVQWRNEHVHQSRLAPSPPPDDDIAAGYDDTTVVKDTALNPDVLHEVLKDFRKEEVKDEGNDVELMGDDMQSEVYASPAVPLPNTMTLDRWRRIVSDCCGQDMCTVDDYPDVLNVFVRYIENEQYFWAQSADQALTRVLQLMKSFCDDDKNLVREYDNQSSRAGAYSCGEYNRVWVESIDVEHSSAQVWYLDWGFSDLVDLRSLLLFPDEVWQYLPRALPCQLLADEISAECYEQDNKVTVQVQRKIQAAHPGILPVRIMHLLESSVPE